VGRELTLGLTLITTLLSSRQSEALRQSLFEPILALGFRIRGIVSDAEEGIRDAVSVACPGVPHQACQAHCLREAAKPIFEADRALKTDLKRDFRPKLRAVRRKIATLTPTDPFQPILLDYADVLRTTLREGGVPPFELGGVRVFEALQAVEASLRRCQKKGGIRCWQT
jgi:hypothetical protein